MLKEVRGKTVMVKNGKGQIGKLSYGWLVWGAGNVVKPTAKDLRRQLPQHPVNRRGLLEMLSGKERWLSVDSLANDASGGLKTRDGACSLFSKEEDCFLHIRQSPFRWDSR